MGTPTYRLEDRRGQRAQTDAIPALTAFLDDLASAGVRYCLWKSNIRLPEGLAGRTDLDLLLDRRSVPTFRHLAARHGLKPLVPQPRAVYPGMEHLLGMDRASGRLFHLHVHHRLVLGERYIKNHRIPLEEEFLHATRLVQGVPVPVAEVELSILAVRALLKYRGRDVVKDLLGIRSPGVPAEIRSEVDWLLDQTTVDAVLRFLLLSRAPVNPAIVGRFLSTLQRRPRAALTFLHLRGRLRADLRGAQRRHPLQARTAYLAQAWQQRRRFRRETARNGMTPATGGLAVALIGVDGAGKSTIAAALVAWLGWKLQVRTCYQGSKAPSRRSRWSYLAFRALRRGHRGAVRTLGPTSPATRTLAAARDTLLAAHHRAVGQDRLRRYRRARGEVQAGTVVVFDRFPASALSSDPEHRLLDGPQVAAALGPGLGRVAGALAAREERLYGHFALPDVLIVLQSSPQVSARRKPDHPLPLLVAKSRAAGELAALADGHPGTTVARVDANRPLAEVLVEVKRVVWDAL